MGKAVSVEKILETARSYQPACVLAAAADLDLFGLLGNSALTAEEVARATDSDARATTVLLNALTALRLLEKHGDSYAVPRDVGELLTFDGARSVLPMVQHQTNCLRRWAQLTEVIKTGEPAKRTPSVRGEDADYAAFIGAMDNVCAPVTDKVIEDIGPLKFRHVLDVGGASGTWTIALLRHYPDARATLFDLAHVIPMAQHRVADARLSDRVDLVAGDFETAQLPRGADLAWVSAIIHQNSRGQNRRLFRAIYEALSENGQILIRDVIMDESGTSPVYGALFAINMLVATEGGGTYTLKKIQEDLETEGFGDMTVLRHDEGMNSVVYARKRQ